MTVTTSKGKTFDIDWMWGPVGEAEDLMLQLRDGRTIAEIAADFEGCDLFYRRSDTEGDMEFAGYTSVVSAARVRRGGKEAVQLTLERQKGGDAA